jgi:tyrosyl-DNA phosphodiesterase 2
MSGLIARLRRPLWWMLHPRRSVSVGRFDVRADRWVDVEDVTAVERDDLTVATYNIWFSDYWAEERYRAIAEVLSAEAPDVIVFQEVTSGALAEFLVQPWLREHYYRAAATGDDFGNYGMLMLSRLPISGVSYNRLPTRLGRGFLQAELTVNGRGLVICSVHLESGKAKSQLRARQLRRVFRALGTAEDVLILGDFNMRDVENDRIRSPYIDIWPALRPCDDGFTEDTSINFMRYDSKNKSRHVRFDRILLKGGRWAPSAIKLLGTEPISDDLPRVFPSDHFGVLCRVVRSPNSLH